MKIDLSIDEIIVLSNFLESTKSQYSEQLPLINTAHLNSVLNKLDFILSL